MISKGRKERKVRNKEAENEERGAIGADKMVRPVDTQTLRHVTAQQLGVELLPAAYGQSGYFYTSRCVVLLPWKRSLSKPIVNSKQEGDGTLW